VREPGVKLAERPSLKTPAEAARVLAEYIGERDREVFVIALLTVRHRLIGVHTVSVGCLASSLVHPREVMKPAILASAACLVLAHNHPSGVMRRSPLCGLRRGLDLVATWGVAPHNAGGEIGAAWRAPQVRHSFPGAEARST
jgi:hypothetical protein